MKENTIIRLKEDFVFFQDGEYICIYNKATRMEVLKLKTGAGVYNDDIREDLNRPHMIGWLAKQSYWKWLGIVILKYPDFFEELTVSEAEKYVKKADYFSVVDRTHFAENYRVSNSFEGTRVFLWGTTAQNKLLYDGLKTIVDDIYLIRSDYEMVDENSFLGKAEEEALGAGIPAERIVGRNALGGSHISKDDIFIIDASGMSREELLDVNDYVIRRNAIALFYGNTNKNIMVGPLVIGGESACIHCMENQEILDKYYPGTNGFLDMASYHLLTYFIIRILYYAKGKNLYYLLSDSQIPINKVITVSKEDTTAKMKYLHRDTQCPCCNKYVYVSVVRNSAV